MRVCTVFHSSCAALLLVLTLCPLARAQLTGVSFDRPAFAPSRGERVRLRYQLTEPSAVTIRLYDPDGGLMAELVNGAAQSAGEHEVEWDGRDLDAQLAPDEAYTVLATAAKGVFDPAASSGGQVGDITQATFDREAGTLVYALPAAARVLIRCGLGNGPMLRTLVDWRPRIGGTITEYWDGRDEDGVTRFADHKDFKALITYVTLPEGTVIAHGNTAETYRDFKLGRGKGRPRKEGPPESVSSAGRAPKGLVPAAWSRTPRVLVTFPDSPSQKSDVVEVGDRVAVRVDVDESDRQQLLSDQFEVIFFVDNVFFGEAERGYLPMTWPWELHQLPPGEHLLTVNISSFSGQVGVASRKVHLVRKNP